jgi:hypothetical protein
MTRGVEVSLVSLCVFLGLSVLFLGASAIKGYDVQCAWWLWYAVPVLCGGAFWLGFESGHHEGRMETLRAEVVRCEQRIAEARDA